jgi:phosphotransferase system  glucose/maltose/N-acetylglucosamine-specific IIC component
MVGVVPLRIMNSQKPFLYVLLGMIGGGLIGFIVFYSLDQTKGWNPYGWWFIGTFILTILGWLGGLLIFSLTHKPSQLNKNLN